MCASFQRLFCDDLATHPLPGAPLVLVTGASGYAGGRLVPELLARGYRVRAMFRRAQVPYPRTWKGVEVVYADCLDPHQMRRALDRVEYAYYLIHSMAVRRSDFETPDLTAASTFRTVAAECGVRRIIYLGALRGKGREESVHLRSRRRVEEILAEGRVPVTTLRAGVIVGSGSASFEMIRSMVARHRFLPIVRAFRYRCQPIAIRDIVKYLVGTLETPQTAGRALDIGGPEPLTYRQMLQECANAMGRRVRVIYVPNLWPGFVAWWLSMTTPVPRSIAKALLTSLRCDVVCSEQTIRQWLDFPLIPFVEAVERALRREALDEVTTRWADASLGIATRSTLAKAMADGSLRRMSATRLVDVSPDRVF
ncbi:MAG: NmrA family NAD(P)-binding protein, partial [Planctomycetota bacterium]